MIFRTGDKEYRGDTAHEIVRAMRDDCDDCSQADISVREFLLWSLARYGDRIPLREIDVSERLDEEMLALGYLYLRDEYHLGELSDLPNRSRWSRHL